MGAVAGAWVRERTLRRRRRGWALAAACAGLTLTLQAAAQEDPDAAETAAARSIALEGIKLADAGRCDEAVDRLARAEKLHHAPVVLGRLGECQVALGKLVEGTENLRKVLREALPPDAPPVVSKARERAAAVLERAKARIAALHIVVKGPADSNAVSVVVDGQPMNVALLDADRPTDPGEHFVEASAVGYLGASARVSVTAGDKQNVVLTLEPDPRARSLASGTAAAPDSAAARTDSSNVFTRVAPFAAPTTSGSQPETSAAAPVAADHTAAYVAWAAGGAAIAAGSIFGLVAFSSKGDLDEQCPDHVCPESSQDRLDSARSASTAATVLMALGGAGLALGTVFYFSAGPSAEGSAADDTGPPSPGLEQRKAALQARAWIGLGQVGVSGKF